ncbi:MAG: LicD family protein [Prevotella sp.]|nr:LicD family protein [Prevotella sp.]
MKKRTIVINNAPFTFEDEILDLYYDNIRPITVDEAKNLLQTAKKLFDEKGIKFYLAFGTLLGAVRDKTLIKGDEDVDIYIEDEKSLYTPVRDKN